MHHHAESYAARSTQRSGTERHEESGRARETPSKRPNAGSAAGRPVSRSDQTRGARVNAVVARMCAQCIDRTLEEPEAR